MCTETGLVDLLCHVDTNYKLITQCTLCMIVHIAIICRAGEKERGERLERGQYIYLLHDTSRPSGYYITCII